MISLLLLTSTAALAWDATGATWDDADMPIPWFIAAELGGGLEEEAAVAAITAGVEAWDEVSCADVSFEYAGRAQGSQFGDPQDGRNVIFIVDAGWPDDPALVTAPVLYTAGARVVEADVALNAQHYAWSTDGDGTVRMDVQAGITHSVGHMLGLWHSNVTGASLNPALAGQPEARSLEDDDIDGLCTLYPVGAAGDGALGDPCVETPDCEGDLFCLVDGADRYCTESCEDDASCPEGYACLALGDGSGACAVDAGGSCGGCASTGPQGAGLLGLLLLAVSRRRPTSIPLVKSSEA
ncbi:MAG: matrixin family metalloprotease [Alphaproteobacteria bacterium]|nr:matrixin family metalloprotease [Alphaproteobacteria bacterium]